MVLDRRLMLCCRPLLFWSTRLCGSVFLASRTNAATEHFFHFFFQHTQQTFTDLRDISEKGKLKSQQCRSFSFLSLLYIVFRFFQHLFKNFKNKILCLGFFRFLPSYIFRNRVALWPGRLVSCGQLNRDSLYEEREAFLFSNQVAHHHLFYIRVGGAHTYDVGVGNTISEPLVSCFLSLSQFQNETSFFL